MDTAIVWKGFKDELLGFINKRVGNSDDAKDILQDVFMKIHLNKSGLKEEASLASWVYQITRNAIIDYYRKNKKRDLEIPESEENENYSPEQSKQFSKCLESHINALPNEYKEAFTEIELNGMSQKDFAEKIERIIC